MLFLFGFNKSNQMLNISIYVWILKVKFHSIEVWEVSILIKTIPKHHYEGSIFSGIYTSGTTPCT